MANCREDIEDFPVISRGVSDSIGGKHWQLQRPCDADGHLIAPLLLAFPVALDFDIHTVFAEDSYQPFGYFAACFLASADERCGQWAFVSTCEANQAGRVSLEVIEGSRTFALDTLPYLEAGDELTKILIADPRLA
jgi:hypothetical protein